MLHSRFVALALVGFTLVACEPSSQSAAPQAPQPITPPSADVARVAPTSPIPDAATARDAGVANATVDASTPRDAATVVAPSPMVAVNVQIVSATGTAMVDATDRPMWERPAPEPQGVFAATPTTTLHPGDRLETGPGDSAFVLKINGGVELHVGPQSRLVIPAFGGSDLIVARGSVRFDGGHLTGPMRERSVWIDTPAVRVTASTGAGTIVVADDAATAVIATQALTAYPSPAAPTTQLLGTRVVPRTHADAGHPVSLDVVINDVVLSNARVLRAISIGADRAVAYSSSGGSLPAPNAKNWSTWLTQRNAVVARPDGHLPVIATVSRAGAGDIADAALLLERLTGHPVELNPIRLPTTSDAGLEPLPVETTHPPDAGSSAPVDPARTRFVLAATLGRLAARADRGRHLAMLRGGTVTALVAMARYEDSVIAARSSLVEPITPP